MTIKVREIKDPGVADKERLVLDVVQNDEIGNYLVFHVRVVVGSDKFQGRVLQSYWFPNQAVHAKDVVVLYTKNGTDNVRENKDKSTSHFYYWGLEKPLWGSSEFTAVFVRAEWQVAHKATEEQMDLPIAEGEVRERAK